MSTWLKAHKKAVAGALAATVTEETALLTLGVTSTGRAAALGVLTFVATFLGVKISPANA